MTKKWYSINARANKTAEVFIYGDIGASWFDESITAKQFVADIKDLDVDT